MDNLRQAELVTMLGVQKYIIDHPELKVGNPTLSTESDSLDANILAALNAGNVKGKTETINANDVDAAKKLMSDTIMKLLGKAIVKCRQIPKNESLENKLTRHADYIYKAVKITAVENATEMLAILSDPVNLAYLNNIKASDITAATLLVTKYDGIKELPEQTIKTKKETGSKIVKQSVTAGRLNVTNLITLVKADWEDINPNMYEGIVDVAKVVVLGLRLTPMEVLVLKDEDGTPITNAQSSEQMKRKVKKLVADITGTIREKSRRAGNCTLIITASGFVDYILKEKINKRVLNSFVVRMKRSN